MEEKQQQCQTQRDLAYATRPRGHFCLVGGKTGYTYLYDWHARKQDRSRSLDGGSQEGRRLLFLLGSTMTLMILIDPGRC